ncbi:MAG TPA: glycosyltransferase family 2 protein [Vicinamibacterales bacterium]
MEPSHQSGDPSAGSAVSFVIPLYHSAETIGALVHDLEALSIPGGHEIILVNDGSTDRTSDVCRELVRLARPGVPIVLIEHARNFGEHNAVLTGWRHASGAHIVNLDDDGQNPPAEAARLVEHARATGLDVVFGHYAEKRHSAWRNLGSWFTNRMTDWALDKPRGFYLSSFRCVSGFVARQVVDYTGPYPYLDGLLLQVTQRIGSIEVRHDARRAGRSTYTLRRLMRLWLSAWVNFSLLPLRLATLAGLGLGSTGFVGLGVVVWLWWHNRGPDYGFGWLMTALLIFSGTQLVVLGLIGEYVGRMYLTVNQRPQAVVRAIVRSGV